MKLRIAMLVTLAAAALTAADLPYAGKWKLNPSKSDFGQVTLAYEQLPGGEMKATAEGHSYTFKEDGKDYPTPWGNTISWKRVNDRTWETTNKVNGKVIGTATMTVSADGKALNMDSKTMKADGTSSADKAVFERASGGPGLPGKWKMKNMKITAPGTMELSASGADGLLLKFVDEGGACDAQFDGKDHPATGAMWPSGWTCSIAKAGARGFDATWKKDGKVMFKDAFKLSPDNETLTCTETGAGPEKIKIHYDRQKT